MTKEVSRHRLSCRSVSFSGLQSKSIKKFQACACMCGGVSASREVGRMTFDFLFSILAGGSE